MLVSVRELGTAGLPPPLQQVEAVSLDPFEDGGGEQEAALRRLIQQCGVTSSVELLGPVPQGELKRMIQKETPGSRVTYRITESGESRSIEILGPWDAGADGTINYLAPAAKPLLGKESGATVTIPSEHGPIEVRIDVVELLI